MDIQLFFRIYIKHKDFWRGGRAMFNHWHDLLEWIQAVMTCRQKEGPCQKKEDAENKAHQLIDIEWRTCQGLLQAIVCGLKFTLW